MKKFYAVIFFFYTSFLWSQTTDLSVSLEITDTNGVSIPSVVLFQEFNYICTISNSGNAVSNATFSQVLDPNVTVLSFESINPLGGADLATNLAFDNPSSTLTALLPNMPAASSVQIRIRVRAPADLGGISTTATVTPPDGTTDTMPDGNTSIISMDVTFVPINFAIDYQQISPSSGTGISAWGDQVTFEFTITNNSAIEYPINHFRLFQELVSDPINGTTEVELISLDCIGTTNGATCPTDINTTGVGPIIITSTQNIYQYDSIIFPSQSSITFRVVYAYHEVCGETLGQIITNSYVEINIPVVDPNDPNPNPNIYSNEVNTDLLSVPPCPCTDVTIETIQTNPVAGTTITDWNQTITFQTTVTNNGPLDTTIRYFFQNLGVQWEFVSVTCMSASGGLNCSDINYIIGASDQFWSVEDLMIPTGAQIITETVVRYQEPLCPSNGPINSQLRSTVNMLEHLDCNPNDNDDFDLVLLPEAPGTMFCVDVNNILASKTQVSPALPLGSNDLQPAPWDDITYHITITNTNMVAVPLAVQDLFGVTMPSDNFTITGTLQSVNCISTTGTADCITVTNANIGVPLTQDDAVFWEITEDENWELPAESSITFEVVVSWAPECTNLNLPVTNKLEVTLVDENAVRKTEVVTYLTPCVDLIIQTYPSQVSAPVNSNFNWIVDITNSVISSTATDAIFTTTIDPAFTINGTPTCAVTSGNATCISTFTINGNTISGIIPLLDPDATIQIQIPVAAPNYGGSFGNTAEVQPNPASNGEFDPDSNISISSMQVLSPSVLKSFMPDEITALETSVLTFTIQNIPGNASQSGIAFTDNLPAGVVLAGNPFWVASNGCTADFVGTENDPFVGITNLVFPDGVSECTFAVLVTSANEGLYTNEFANFSNLINIDASGVFATLNVLPLPPSTDVSLQKSVNNPMPSIGDEISFSITASNLSDTDATNVIIEELLPSGYAYNSHTTTAGSYDDVTQLWTLPILMVGTTETLTLNVIVLDEDDYINNVQVQSITEPDTDLSNNSAQAATTPDCIEISQGLSPNGDTINDFWKIKCIENYTNNELLIYNRWGTLVYKDTGDIAPWNGTSNQGYVALGTSKKLPVGTYFYVLRLNADAIQKTGWVYLNY